MTTQQVFWQWFSEHEYELMHFERDRERVFDQLAIQLKKVDPDLTFEFGPNRERREFVVSAGGIHRAFPVVSALVASAPVLKRWKITAFRPRRSPPNTIELGGKRVSPADVRFTLLDDGKSTGIYLFIPGFTEADKNVKQIGYLILDDVLGEYDVETKLGLVKMLPPEAKTTGVRYPLSELAVQFDELVSQLGLADPRA